MLSDVGADLVGVDHGVGFALFVKDGRLDFLEGFTYADAWPAVTELLQWHYLRHEGGCAALLETPVRDLARVQSELEGRHPQGVGSDRHR